MKLMDTRKAAGQVLCQDITQIIKGGYKGPVFRKGHVITEEDIPVLLSVGKDHIYIWEHDDTMLHENDGARILCDLCSGSNIAHADDIKEGKIEFTAGCDGLLKVDTERLNKINSLGEMMIATIHGNFPVKKGDKLGGTRVIPLVISKEKMEKAAATVEGAHILNILPYQQRKAGIVTTGNEVYYGRIEDTFTEVVISKLRAFGVEIVGHEISSDDPEMEIQCIRKLIDEGADMICCTGGMSVDPDDKTPYAIKTVCGKPGIYGAPVLPGAMFMLDYYGEEDIPVMGLPGCVMHARRTIFDLVLPRIMAGEHLAKEDIDTLGEGGFCLNCRVCTFPNCGFGK
ncbi:MAG: molybdopterin-binding protein [Eubacteriales bacterium]|jgi:hypothetical protein|nr:molybdopterin-binding protein [Eubacteriales bacterium]